MSAGYEQSIKLSQFMLRELTKEYLEDILGMSGYVQRNNSPI